MILAAAEGAHRLGWPLALLILLIVSFLSGLALAAAHHKWPKRPDPTEILKQEEKRWKDKQ